MDEYRWIGPSRLINPEIQRTTRDREADPGGFQLVVPDRLSDRIEQRIDSKGFEKQQLASTALKLRNMGVSSKDGPISGDHRLKESGRMLEPRIEGRNLRFIDGDEAAVKPHFEWPSVAIEGAH